ncbi:inner nuclear membrane protein enriched at telomere/subtelomere region, partial [Coemansia sp. RSA 2708]
VETKPVGTRTRSQTPRTERTRARQFGADSKEEEPKKKKKRHEKDASGKIKKKSSKAAEPASPPRTVGKAADVKRTGAKRKLSDAEPDASVDSGDDEFFTPNRPARTAPRVPREGTRRDGDERGFSDENPFQSSPEAARKRRRKADAGTPLSALRKSQPSDVAFRVSLPARGTSPEPESDQDMARADEPPQPLQFAAAEEGERHRARVSELVAKYQQQQPQPERPRSPTVRIRDGLPHEPAEPKRFTMTPDALRELAAAQAPEPGLNKPTADEPIASEPSRRRLPPVAPGIPVARAAPGRTRLAAELGPNEQSLNEPGPDEPSFEQAAREAHELQRRRVATLRQHVESAAAAEARAAKTHSRRSSIASIASSVGEARGVPAVPAAAPSTHARRKGAPSWAARLLWAAAAAAAAVTWRAHAQFAVGFGSARAEYAPLAPPADSVLAVGAAPDAAAPLGAHVAHYARRARAYLAPPPLACPEHADCVPYTAIPAQAADAAARDQWIVRTGGQRVAVVQCDAGFVLQFPALTSRLVPRVPACVRDAPTAHRVAQLVAAMHGECRRRRGRALCEQSLVAQARGLRAPADEADEVERLGLSDSALHELLARRRSARLGQDEFDALFALAAAELGARDDVANYVVTYEDDDGSESEATFFVAQHADFPPLCRVQRLALALVVGHAWALALAALAAALAFVASRRVAAFRAEAHAADVLVGSALARLKRQARRHYLDPALSPSPAIPSLQLRDLLMLASATPPPEADASPAYYDPRARSSVWDRVRRVVERNANVRCRTTAVRGEPMRVWEWIGPLDEDDDMMSPFASPQRI